MSTAFRLCVSTYSHIPGPILGKWPIPNKASRETLRAPGTRVAVRSASNITSAFGINHSSLDTFLQYADRSGLSKTSTTYLGTLYEYLCQSALARFGFALEHVGGPADGGVDLKGRWHLPSAAASSAPAPAQELGPSSASRAPSIRSSEPLSSPPVIVQCKALSRKSGPVMVREIEGALLPEPTTTVGVLCGQQPAGKGVIAALKRSARPVMWMQIEQVAERDARVRQMLWNEHVEGVGVRGLSVGIRRSSLDHAKDGEEIVLLWKQEVWKPDEAADEATE